MNSVANHRVRTDTAFQRLFVQPAAGDSGGALGAALYWHHTVLGRPRACTMFDPYLGLEVTQESCREFLEAQAVPYQAFDDDDALCEHVAALLAHHLVVGWVQGRAEWGPRALGCRSILADPRHADMQWVVNDKVKYREPFRPFAPAMLEEASQEYLGISLDTPQAKEAYSPLYYMLEVVPFAAGKAGEVPAVAHVDGTGRVQRVSRPGNPLFWRLITAFRALTGVPVLLNTSFNRRGEPIVNTVEDAYRTFLETGLDVLVVGRHVVTKAPRSAADMQAATCVHEADGCAGVSPAPPTWQGVRTGAHR